MAKEIETLSKKLKESDNKYTKFEESHNKTLEIHNKLTEEKNFEISNLSSSLQQKEKIITTLSQTNKKLIKALEALRQEVDEQFDKVSFKKVNEKDKLIKSEKQNNIETSLKIKEKELKNAYALIDILKHDLNKKDIVNEQSDYYHAYLECKNSLKYEESKNSGLNNEIKLLNKFGDVHKKCIEKQLNFEKEKKQLRDELILLKEKYREINNKHIEEHRPKHFNENESDEKGEEKGEKGEKGSMRNSQRTLSMSHKHKNKNKKHSAITSRNNEESMLDKSRYWSNSYYEQTHNSLDRKTKKAERSSSYLKHNLNIYCRNKNISEDEIKLLSTDLTKKLEGILKKSEIEEIERKYETELSLRISLDNKLKSENKHYNKKISALQEQIEFLNLQLRESETKNKIYSYQVNEKTNDHIKISRKLNENQHVMSENQHLIEEHNKIIREKDIEIHKLLKQNKLLKEISKRNIISPLEVNNEKSDTSIQSLDKDTKKDRPKSRFNKPKTSVKVNNDKSKENSRNNSSYNKDNKDVHIESEVSIIIEGEKIEKNDDKKVISNDEHYNINAQKNKGIDS